KRARQQASQWMFATDKLASPQREVARYAKQQFRDAGWVGRVYLRKAVREKPAGVAAAAAELLTDEGGNKAVTAMLDRLGNADNTPEELTQVLGENMAELAGKAEPKHIRQAYRLFGKASDAGRKASARLLTAYYSDVTQADEAAFNKAAGAAEAYSKLRDMVRKELFSVEDKRRAWAEPLAADLHLYARGLRGQYFTGRSFDKLATTRLDKTPHQTLETLPYADNRKENISVRWTGQIQIETPGKYTFTMASDDGQRLWVDGEKVIDDWMAHGVERESGTVELKTGLHEIRIEWFQGDGGGETTTYWKGPGFEEEKLPADVLLTKPWKAMGSTVDAVQPGEK
ncbi:MAG: PA14 domain-containing protein, partial [Phycisphaerae bacterium]